ncbi:SUR7 family protein pun1 [Schizosaccharomyces pombe]
MGMGFNPIKALFTGIGTVCVGVGALLSILCIINQTQHNIAFQNIYFIQLNTTSIFSVANQTAVVNKTSNLLNELTGTLVDTLETYIDQGATDLIEQVEQEMKDVSELPDWYSIGLWNYCQGNSSDYTNPTYCSTPSPSYYFNPLTMLETSINNATGSQINITLPSEVDLGLKVLKGACYAMRAMYILGFIFFALTIVSIVISCLPFFGPLFLNVFSFFATIFTFIAAVIAVATYRIAISELEKNIEILNIPIVLGKKIYAYSFLSAAAGLAACILYFIGNLTSGYSPL